MRSVVIRRYRGQVIVLLPDTPGNLVGDPGALECLAFAGRRKLSVRPEEVMAQSESVSPEEAEAVIGIYAMNGISDLESVQNIPDGAAERRRAQRRAQMGEARSKGAVHTDPEDEDDRIPIQGSPSHFVPLNFRPSAAVDPDFCRRVVVEACKATPTLVTRHFYFRSEEDRERFPIQKAQEGENWRLVSEAREGNYQVRSFACAAAQVGARVYEKDGRMVGVEILSD